MRSRAGNVRPGPAAARHERRDRDVQPIEQARFEKPRHRRRRRLRRTPTTGRARAAARAARRASAAPSATGTCRISALPGAGASTPGRVHDERRRGAVREHAAPRVEPRGRIEHDADGIRARDVPHRELRIVARDGAGADDDGGRQRAQPVQSAERCRGPSRSRNRRTPSRCSRRGSGPGAQPRAGGRRARGTAAHRDRATPARRPAHRAPRRTRRRGGRASRGPRRVHPAARRQTPRATSATLAPRSRRESAASKALASLRI